jgi:hypothetical protein
MKDEQNRQIIGFHLKNIEKTNKKFGAAVKLS